MKYADTIAQIKKLLKEGQPQQAIQLAIMLREQYPTVNETHKLLTRCKEAVRGQEVNQREQFIKNALKTIHDLLRKKDFDRAVQGTKELLIYEPNNPKAQKLHEKTSVAYIESKLHDPNKSEWEKAREYEKLYLFYQKLRKVFPTYTKLKKLIQITEKKMLAQDRERKKEFAKTSLEKLKALYVEGKYEQVIKGTEELMAFTHQGSTEAKKLHAKAMRSNDKEIEKLLDAFMVEQEAVLHSAYINKQERMIKV